MTPKSETKYRNDPRFSDRQVLLNSVTQMRLLQKEPSDLHLLGP